MKSDSAKACSAIAHDRGSGGPSPAALPIERMRSTGTGGTRPIFRMSRITSYNVCYTKLLRTMTVLGSATASIAACSAAASFFGVLCSMMSYNFV